MVRGPIACPRCGRLNSSARTTCKSCGASLNEPEVDVSAVPLSIEERKAILDAEIANQVKLGWRVASRTDTTAQLVADKKPDGCVAVLLLLFLLVPGILYLLLYRGSRSLYLEVNEQGRVLRTQRD